MAHEITKETAECPNCGSMNASRISGSPDLKCDDCNQLFRTRDDDLDLLATKIKSAGDLWQLRDALVAFESRADINADGYGHRDNDIENELKQRGIDICELPIYGGVAPKSTAEVWSWDAEYILTGIGPFSDWEIRERK